MILLLFALFTVQVNAQNPESQTAPAPAPVTAPAAEPAAPAPAESSDYEVDYEEEPNADEVEEPEEKPVPKKVKKAKGIKNAKESVTQGSRAEKKIAPMMKSETKSIYKKNGKSLDVDSD